MSAVCPFCKQKATEIKITPDSASFRGGCVHLRIYDDGVRFISDFGNVVKVATKAGDGRLEACDATTSITGPGDGRKES